MIIYKLETFEITNNQPETVEMFFVNEKPAIRAGERHCEDNAGSGFCVTSVLMVEEY